MPQTLTYHNGWALRWSGWRYLPNQNLSVGWWLAAKGGKVFYATTTGLVEEMRYGPFQSLNLVQHDVGWPSIEQPEEMRKRDVLNHLKYFLDTGKTW